MVSPVTPPRMLVKGDVVAGKYLVERTLGMGGMGQVIQARHVELGTLVAIKLIHPHTLDAESTERFKREARMAAGIQSEHIVRVFDIGETPEGLPYMVMEHLDGRDLAAVLADRGPLPIDATLDYVMQACEALAEAHDVGIVHRDLKPQNLFLTRRRSGEALVKVLDFGLAKSLFSEPGLKLTAHGIVVGTPQYMAPEQIRGDAHVDARADIWAVGACMFRLLTREYPFPATSVPALCAAIVSHAPRSVRELRPEVPAEVEAIILKCMRPSRGDRFENARELRAALGSARAGAGTLLPGRRSFLEEDDPATIVGSLDEDGATAVGTLPPSRGLGGTLPLGDPPPVRLPTPSAHLGAPASPRTSGPPGAASAPWGPAQPHVVAPPRGVRVAAAYPTAARRRPATVSPRAAAAGALIAVWFSAVVLGLVVLYMRGRSTPSAAPAARSATSAASGAPSASAAARTPASAEPPEN